MVYPSFDVKSPADCNESANFILPTGAITELASPLGEGKTEWLLRYLANKPMLRVAWLEPGGTEYSSFPSAFPEYGVSLSRVLFIDCGKQLLWAAQQVIKSQIFEIIVIKGSESAPAHDLLNEMDLRRLQLLAEKSQLSIVLLKDKLTQKGAWPIFAQLEISRPAITSELLDFEVERSTPGFKIIRQRQRLPEGSVSGASAIPSWGQKAWQKLGLLPIG